jgi:hypothetical protein
LYPFHEVDSAPVVDNLAEVAADLAAEEMAKLNMRGTTGVLASNMLSADIHIHNFSMTFHGKVKSYLKFKQATF